MNTFIRVALWISAIVTFIASWFLGLVGVGIWLLCWALFLLIFRPWRMLKKVDLTPDQRAAKDQANVEWSARAAERTERMRVKTEMQRAEIDRMKAERVARREMRRENRRAQ